MDFSNLTPSDKIRLVITGSYDELAPYAQLEKIVPEWNPRATLKVIAGADHFYAGESEHVREAVREFLLNENKRGGLR
jgi:alpha/beta superfamily hydrolase